MSCFVLDDKSISAIVNGLSKEKILDFCSEEKLKEFGQEILDLNNSAYSQRYSGKEHTPEVFRLATRDFYYDPNSVVTRIQLYKSLECLLYQCTEGSSTESPLYKKLERHLRTVSYLIISKLPEYSESRWG